MDSNASAQGLPGQTFLSALDEYTKRIETSVAEIEGGSETTLSRLVFILILVGLAAGLLPTASRLLGDLEYSSSYRLFLQTTVSLSILATIGLSVVSIYITLLRARRQRRNLETLLWPYQRLLQKLSQLVEHGNLDEGTSTLIQLKILEAEVAYSRARRVIEGEGAFPRWFFPRRPQKFDPSEARLIADQFEIPLDEAEGLLRRYWPDTERARAVAAERRRQHYN